MAETVGALILSAVGATEVVGIAGFSLASTTIAGFSLATVVGTAAIVGVSIGLQYAFRPSAPGLPKPEDGSQGIKQAIPPRIRGYGTNRLAGYYMAYEATGEPPATSYDLLAFHSGRISEVRGFFLHDDVVHTVSDISTGGYSAVLPEYADGRYTTDTVFLEVALGSNSQTASVLLTSGIPDRWTSNHKGNGIAWLAMQCAGLSDPSAYTQCFPHQLPLPSVIADCSPVWDPRDPAQLRNDESTWLYSQNPVIQLIDYLTREDGGLGLDYETAIEPNIDLWIVEADLCDELVDKDDGEEPRYVSNGWFQFDNKPEDVIGGILSTCDGWLAESGDGTLSIVVGVYREPTDPPLTEKHIMGFSLSYGQADEQMINQIVINYTDPGQKYVSVQCDPWRDEESISASGVVRSQQLDLKWVQSVGQARRLADRAMQRLNPAMNGSFTTTLYGLRYLGKRWIPVQYPFVSGLQDSVIEIQSVDIDLMNGRINWTFNLVGDDIEAYDPETDEGETPPIPPTDVPA